MYNKDNMLAINYNKKSKNCKNKIKNRKRNKNSFLKGTS